MLSHNMAGRGIIQGYFPAGPPKPPASGPGGGMVHPHGHCFDVPASIPQFPQPGPGLRLPEAFRAQAEGLFKADFSGVRVHIGPQATAIGAYAFTHGHRIYFAPGRYNPHALPGRRLLGHELAHVVQQRRLIVQSPLGAGAVIVRDPRLEAEADAMGALFAGLSMAPRGSAPSRPVPAIGARLNPAARVRAAIGVRPGSGIGQMKPASARRLLPARLPLHSPLHHSGVVQMMEHSTTWPQVPNLHQFRPGQVRLTRKTVKDHVALLKGGQALPTTSWGGQKAHAQVFRSGGKWIIQEGHHRFVAALIAGKPITIMETTVQTNGELDWDELRWDEEKVAGKVLDDIGSKNLDRDFSSGSEESSEDDNLCVIL